MVQREGPLQWRLHPSSHVMCSRVCSRKFAVGYTHITCSQLLYVSIPCGDLFGQSSPDGMYTLLSSWICTHLWVMEMWDLYNVDIHRIKAIHVHFPLGTVITLPDFVWENPGSNYRLHPQCNICHTCSLLWWNKKFTRHHRGFDPFHKEHSQLGNAVVQLQLGWFILECFTCSETVPLSIVDVSTVCIRCSDSIWLHKLPPEWQNMIWCDSRPFPGTVHWTFHPPPPG